MTTTNQQTSSDQQVAKTRPVDVLKDKLKAPSIAEQFRNALGQNSDAFVASVIDVYNTDKSLQECNPNQVVMEALKAAVLKLPINRALGYAYILQFKNKGVPTPTFIIGYKGLIQLAMRTGQYKYINADVVYEGEISGRDKLTGAIDFTGQKKSDKVIGYFAHIELLNGFRKTLYSTVEEIAKHAKMYAPTLKFSKDVTVERLIKLAGKEPSGIGWLGDFDSMAIKTVLRELLSKYGYLSIEMQSAIAQDIETDIRAERDNAIEDVVAEEISMEDDTSVENQEEEKKEEEPPY
jgi:recombination protein RecT